jgi:aminotransferase
MTSTLFARNLPESIIKTYTIRIKELKGVNLGQGIPSFPTALHIREAAKIALNEPNIGIYPNFLGTIELRVAIANKLNKRHQLDLDPKKNILVTIGAMEAVATSIFGLISTGNIVGIVTPDYCNHFPIVMLAKGKILEIPMRENKIWELDINKIKKQASKIKLLIITNPNNPTGAVLDKQQIAELVDMANKFGFWILADETYAYLDYEHKFTSLLEFWDQCDRLLVVHTFSKEYAMTGWRVGYVIASSQVVKILAKTHDAIVGCVAKISQKAALAAVTGSQKIVNDYANILKKRRDLACKLLDGMKNVFSYSKPEGAYYIFPRYKNKVDSMLLTRRILEKSKVAVIPGSVFGKAGEGHIRISFAVEDEVLRNGIVKLTNFFI